MIDEKKLIEEIDYYISHTWPDGAEHYAYKKAKELVSRLPKVGEWIPVSEMLPEKDGYYLISTTIYYTPDHVGECDHYERVLTAWYNHNYGFTGEGWLYAKAWMPLSEPYKGEE